MISKEKKLLTLDGFKFPSKEFKEKLNNNRFYIIQGEKDTGKSTIAKTLCSYFKNSIVFSFNKNDNNKESWITLEKNLKLKNSIYEYNNYAICDYITNDELIKMINILMMHQNSKIIFDLDIEEKLFSFLLNLENLYKLKNLFHINNELYEKALSNIIQSVKINDNVLYIHIFKTFHDWIIYKEIKCPKNKLFIVSMENSKIIYSIFQQRILDNLIVITYLENNIIETICKLLDKTSINI